MMYEILLYCGLVWMLVSPVFIFLAVTIVNSKIDRLIRATQFASECHTELLNTFTVLLDEQESKIEEK
jgi:hypothetical protein